MNQDLQTRIAAIKAECENILSLESGIGDDPERWKPDLGCVLDSTGELVAQCDYASTARFIAHSRNVSPAMARVVLMMINECQLREDWEAIANQWEGK